VTVNDAPVDLTPTEFNLLEVMMSTPGRAFSRAELLDQALGDEAFVFERTVDAHIKNLRQKIERNSSKPNYILTVRGVGYKFNEDADAQ
jgi:DNA-binding response OmpR family regulator